jgi:hypothetical protein
VAGCLRMGVLTYVLVLAGCVSDASAQGCVWWDSGSTTVGTYSAITREQRAAWIACGTVGVSSVGIGLANAAVPGWYNTLEDWKRAEAGLAARFGHREADVTVSNRVEAGLGALWGEEPRYVPMGRASHAGVASRLGTPCARSWSHSGAMGILRRRGAATPETWRAMPSTPSGCRPTRRAGGTPPCDRPTRGRSGAASQICGTSFIQTCARSPRGSSIAQAVAMLRALHIRRSTCRWLTMRRGVVAYTRHRALDAGIRARRVTSI